MNSTKKMTYVDIKTFRALLAAAEDITNLDREALILEWNAAALHAAPALIDELEQLRARAHNLEDAIENACAAMGPPHRAPDREGFLALLTAVRDTLRRRLKGAS